MFGFFFSFSSSHPLTFSDPLPSSLYLACIFASNYAKNKIHYLAHKFVRMKSKMLSAERIDVGIIRRWQAWAWPKIMIYYVIYSLARENECITVYWPKYERFLFQVNFCYLLKYELPDDRRELWKMELHGACLRARNCIALHLQNAEEGPA